MESIGFLVVFLQLFIHSVLAQTDTLGLADGYLNFSTKSFNVKLVKDAQVLASLQPVSSSFDFSPFDYLRFRAANGNHHLGDLTARYRLAGTTAWTSIDSATARAHVTPITKSNVFAASDMKPTFSQSSTLPLDIQRQWYDLNGDLGLLYNITNTASSSVEIGSLGFPIEFNNIFSNRTALQTEQTCSLQDPYIGLGAGYVQVTPLQGTGPALVVTGLNGTDFEAWRFLPEATNTNLYYQSQVFEGLYEWQTHTLAWAQNEWKNVTPWNVPTSLTITPGQSFTAGLRFSLAQGGVRDIGDTVKGAGKPYAMGVPGYIVPQDLVADLYVSSNATVNSVTSDPAGALTFSNLGNGHYTVKASSSIWGRTRATLTYSDGVHQSVHYYIPKSAPKALSDLGQFSTTTGFFNYTNDPFHRGPSVLSWDRSRNTFVFQDPRTWIAGLSDEAGAGAWLAACMKQSVQAVTSEINQLDRFVNQTLWGTIQVNGSTSGTYGVRKSVFYYQPDQLPGYQYNTTFNWGGSWNKATAYSDVRAYDYVHVSAAYWALYRVARAHPNLTLSHNWNWYLNQSYQTVMFATARSSNGQWVIPYADDGLMEETVWGNILQDLQRENMTTMATSLESNMRARAEYWNGEAVPFGSEMAWDSTGQEGVYYWSNYFNLTTTANKTISSILGYQPTVAHWGWNGNARRYWDNLYGGSLQYARIERQIHHYGSALNAQPLLSYYRQHPSDTYVLRVGYGGISGPLSSIQTDGSSAASFHSWPDTLLWDPYSGDYGSGFLGMALSAGVYVVEGSSLGVTDGIVAFGGQVSNANTSTVTVSPKDPVRRRVYVAPFGTLVEIDAGAIDSVDIDMAAQTATFHLLDAVPDIGGQPSAPAAIVWVSTESLEMEGGFGVTTTGLTSMRGGSRVVFGGDGTATVTIGKIS